MEREMHEGSDNTTTPFYTLDCGFKNIYHSNENANLSACKI